MTDFLTTPGCGGALTESERLYIRDAAQTLAARFGANFRAVNIGVDKGGTLWCIRAGAPACELIGIDINPESERGDWQFIHSDSRRAPIQVDAPIHLLLIDGDHDYYGVRADILNWTPKVAEGGIVIFHDYGNAEKYVWTAGVKRAVDEWMGTWGLYDYTRGWKLVRTADSILAFEKKETA